MMRQFDPKEIAEADGKEGRPVFIVYDGKVFDVTGSKLWRNGLHMRRHQAGRDLTADVTAAPHGAEVFERYPRVGTVREEDISEKPAPRALFRLLERYPMLRRHPHPMTVHFPIVFMLSVTFFNLLYLVTGNKSFEVTALHCLAGGVLFIPAVMATGLLTWWLNYMARPLKPVNVKIAASLIMFVVALIAFTWRVQVPGILDSFGIGSVIYLLLILSLAPLVIIVGWYGAKLTFPIGNE